MNKIAPEAVTKWLAELKEIILPPSEELHLELLRLSHLPHSNAWDALEYSLLANNTGRSIKE